MLNVSTLGIEAIYKIILQAARLLGIQNTFFVLVSAETAHENLGSIIHVHEQWDEKRGKRAL